ncbi:MAG: hypothetical protein ACO1NK_09780 [Sediminibacterium sp.]
MKAFISKFKITVLFSFLLIGCANQQEHVVVSSQVVKEDPGDVIYTNSTIIIQPTQLQLDSLQQKLGESNFQIVQGDYVFYANAMTGFFSDKNVVKYTFSGVNSLHYKNAEGKVMKYNLEQNGESWQLYFYSPEKGFRRVDFVDYESAFTKFFNQ